MTKTIAISLILLSSALAQTSTAGKVSVQGTAQMSSSAPAPFNILTLTSHGFSPSTTVFPGFPTVDSGAFGSRL
jgi:hypothetical protein